MKTKLTRHLIAGVAAGLALTATVADAASAVGDLLPGYYTVQRALAADDFNTARSAAGLLADQARKTAESGLAGAATAVAQAADITAARSKFEELSTVTQALVEAAGAGLDPVYVVRCPMAFEGKGATWLQGDDAVIANPYYGAAMLRCGSVIKRLGGGTDAAGAAHQGHGSH